MNYEAAEDSIIALLQPITAGGQVIVSHAPECDDDMKTPAKPEIWVMYNNGTFELPGSTDAKFQGSKIDFEIIFRSRTRRGPKGVYALMLAAKNLLICENPNKNIFQSVLYLTEENLLQFDDRKMWIYRQVYSTKSISLQSDSTEADIILTNINTTDNITVEIGI